MFSHREFQVAQRRRLSTISPTIRMRSDPTYITSGRSSLSQPSPRGGSETETGLFTSVVGGFKTFHLFPTIFLIFVENLTCNPVTCLLSPLVMAPYGQIRHLPSFDILSSSFSNKLIISEYGWSPAMHLIYRWREDKMLAGLRMRTCVKRL